ncbi:MAG: hypothetical protein VXX85_06150 [Candidatus Margulisiibacteriota bacterium]|nr:hypothetical protein [Candidatus Margulisiibacteriota bacterium]
MFRNFLLIVLISLVSLFVFNGFNSKTTLDIPLELRIQDDVSRYLTKRLGLFNPQVVVHVEMTPTTNNMVIERFIPQKVTTKQTSIGSSNATQPMGVYATNSDSGASNSAFDLPGMSVFNSSPKNNSVESSTIPVTSETSEAKEQQLIEHVFYNKEVDSIQLEPQLKSLRVAFFLPEDILTINLKRELSAELNQLLNGNNTIDLSLIINPIVYPPVIVSLYSNYDATMNWVQSNPIYVLLIVIAFLMVGVLIQFLKFKMDLKRNHHKQTVLIKDSPTKKEIKPLAKHTLPKKQEPLILNATPKDLVHFLTSGVIIEEQTS